MTRRTSYELSASQVSTPLEVVDLFWDLTKKYRDKLGHVLDVGAGDCRFGHKGHYEKYTGIEIDKERARSAKVPPNGRLINGCAFEHKSDGYDACIGNPPYVRHHDLEVPWKENTVAMLERQLGTSLSRNCNLYLHFMGLGVKLTRDDGIVALVIPFEWVSRPSAKPLRDFITRKKWNVAVYRFPHAIFEGVLTTASISIIDKSKNDGCWHYYDVDHAQKIVERPGLGDAKSGILPYEKRGTVWALRGLSPGSQQIFTLSENERIHNGLRRDDVVPCVTSFKHVPSSLKTLTQASFKRHFIDAGQKCWLIKSYQRRRSRRLDAYLGSIPKADRTNWTCTNQEPWYNFRPHPVAELLVASGFTSFGPKVVVNSIGARAIGAIYGVHGKHLPRRALQSYLLSINFEEQIVPHANSLKKVEIKQLNAVLNDFVSRKHRNG